MLLSIDNEWVCYAGLKSEEVLRDQFTNASGECSQNVGDEVQVAETVEDGFGETKLSRRLRAEAWKTEAVHRVLVVMGVINGKVKGGFTVDVDSIRAFLLGSLIDVRPIRETVHLEGKELEFKVKLDQKRNNVVASNKSGSS